MLGRKRYIFSYRFQLTIERSQGRNLQAGLFDIPCHYLSPGGPPFYLQIQPATETVHGILSLSSEMDCLWELPGCIETTAKRAIQFITTTEGLLYSSSQLQNSPCSSSQLQKTRLVTEPIHGKKLSIKELQWRNGVSKLIPNPVDPGRAVLLEVPI
ncbi:uncharacterized protein LOC121831008 [Peromyscus maniculatus bairdii]|uniref:uncharacterized protein LOC121831008 n=1 Tax=Peromyscus maniculatus bairdii TaxID=230844 RepID=UPI003FD0F54D